MKKLFMASLALITFTASIALFQLSSCKKADAQTQTTYPIQGLYTGTYSVNAVPAQGNLFYSFVIYPDGTMSTKGKGGDGKDYYSAGTWTLSNNIFSGTVTTIIAPNGGAPVTQSITATFSNTGIFSNGSWNDTNNPNGVGNAGKYSIMQRAN